MQIIFEFIMHGYDLTMYFWTSLKHNELSLEIRYFALQIAAVFNFTSKYLIKADKAAVACVRSISATKKGKQTKLHAHKLNIENDVLFSK